MKSRCFPLILIGGLVFSSSMLLLPAKAQLPSAPPSSLPTTSPFSEAEVVKPVTESSLPPASLPSFDANEVPRLDPDGSTREFKFTDPGSVYDENVVPTSAIEPFVPRAAQSAPAPARGIGSVAVPTIEIRQVMPEEIKAGQPISVELIVTNTGSVSVDKVIVTNPIAGGAQFVEGIPSPVRSDQTLIWSLGGLEPTEHRIIQFSVQLPPDSNAPTFENTPEVSCVARVSGVTKISSARLVLTVNGPEVATVGVPAEFDISLSNLGTAPATNVVLRDQLPEGLSHLYGPDLENEVGNIAPGETRRIRLALVPTRTGRITNTIEVSSAETELLQKQIAITAEQVNLQVVAKAQPVRYVNRPCSYEFVVTNTGNLTAKQARIMATLPSGLTFAHASDLGQHDTALHAVYWDLGEIGPAETKRVTLTAVGTEIGDQTCRVAVTADGNVSEETTCTTLVRGVAGLGIEVVDSQDPIEIGEDSTYEIRITNTGTAPATNLRVTAEIPSEVEATNADPADNTIQDGTLVFQTIAKLEPKKEVVFRVRVKGRHTGNGRFRVEVVTDEFRRPIIEEESTTVYGDDG